MLLFTLQVKTCLGKSAEMTYSSTQLTCIGVYRGVQVT